MTTTTQDDPEISAALVDWVNTFNLPKQVTSLGQLYDGTVVSLILNDIDPTYFGDSVVRGKGSVSVNWVQHFNVLKKLLRNINEYYGDVLRTKPPNLPTEESPNLSSIAKEKSVRDTIKFLRLVLALAVKSDKKEDYVQTIYTLSPDAQKSLMYLLQQVISEPSPTYSPTNGLLSEDDQTRFEEEIAGISAERDAIEKARLTLLEDHQKLKADSERLQKSLEAAETRARDAEEAARSLGNKADSYMRAELDRLQQELFPLKSRGLIGRQDVEAKSMKKDTLLETRNTLITGLNRQVEELRPRADQAARFEEELKEVNNELAQTHKKVQRLENIVEKYKQKAEESNALLRQNEILEDENAQLKESIRRGDINQFPLRGRGEIARLETMERTWIEEKEVLQQEVDRLKSRLQVAEEQTGRDASLIATLEERLKESASPGSAELEDVEGEDLNDEISTSRKDLRQQVIRLERELAAAKAETEFSKLSANGSGKESELHERFVKYEAELSAANRTIAELTVQSSSSIPSKDLQWRLDHLTDQLTKAGEDKNKLATEKDVLQKQLDQQKDRLLEAERESSRLKSSLAGIEGEAGGQVKGETLQLQKSLRDLTTDSKIKDAEIQKLRDLVKKQDQKLKEGKAKLAKATAGADQALRDENVELTKQINHAKKSHREEISLKNKELQMIASAFHDLGSRTQLNGFVVEKQAHSPASFLAQQRNSIPSLSKKD